MGVTYAKEATAVRPYKLPHKVLLNMARIVRSCAEIEDLVGLHLNRMAEINEGQSLLLIGRMPISTKLSLAHTLAQAVGDACLAAHQACFGDEQFAGLQKCRNAIAHGLLLGKVDDGKIAFRTVNIAGADGPTVSVDVVSYEADDFRKYAALATELVPYIEKRLKLQALREKRRGQVLLPHRKAQPTREPSAKHPRQQKPSGE